MSRTLREFRRALRLWRREQIVVGISTDQARALAAEYAFGDRSGAYEVGAALGVFPR